MKQERKQISIYQIALLAVFAALVFVSNWLQFEIPVPVGTVSRIHLGNVFCLLSGFVLGPISGGLASGVGAALFDLLNPKYITSAPFTFVFKFLLAAVCGWAAWAGGKMAEDHKRNILAAVAGSVTYIILYLGKSFVQGLLLGSEMGTILTSLVTKLAASSVNAVLAVAISVPLCAAIRLALKKSGLMEKRG